MENNYAERMALKTDDDLQLYLDNYLSYTPEAIMAAKNELERRGRIFSEEELLQLNKNLEEKHTLAIEEEKVFEESITERSTNTSARMRWADFVSIFTPNAGYRITPILVILNLLYFIIILFAGANIINPDAELLFNAGGNFGVVTVNGQWWRLITCMFIHGGIMHLLVNMYALIYIGLMLEPILGKARFLSAYFLTGVVASITSIAIHPQIVAVGASGAIFGMFGVYLALLTTNILPKETKKATLINIVLYVALNLANGMKAGIDNAAHVGGLTSGIVVGYAYYYSLKHFEWKGIKYATISITAFFMIILSVIILKNMPNPVHEQENTIASYQEKIEHFATLETEALAALNWPESTPKEKLLYEVKDRGIYYWNKCLVIISEIDQLDIPYEVRKKNEKLKNYCELRKQEYELIYKQIDEETKIYKPKIVQIDSEIAVVMKDLGVDVDK
jgi:rhomboid protease GluP